MVADGVGVNESGVNLAFASEAIILAQRSSESLSLKLLEEKD